MGTPPPTDDGEAMGQFLVDDGFFHHHKAITAGPLACCLYLAGLAHCNAQFTNGFLHLKVVSTLVPCLRAPRLQVERLLAVGLWERAVDGYQVHNYQRRNPSAESRKSAIDLARTQSRARSQDYRDRQRHAPVTAVTGVTRHGLVTHPSEQSSTEKQESESLEQGDNAVAAPALERYLIPDSIRTTLGKCPFLTSDPRVSSEKFWRAAILAGPGTDFPRELLRAERWCAASPDRAPKKRKAAFLSRWFERAESDHGA